MINRCVCSIVMLLFKSPLCWKYLGVQDRDSVGMNISDIDEMLYMHGPQRMDPDFPSRADSSWSKFFHHPTSDVWTGSKI